MSYMEDVFIGFTRYSIREFGNCPLNTGRRLIRGLTVFGSELSDIFSVCL